MTADEHEFEIYQSSLLSQVSAAIVSTANFFYLDRDSNYEGRIPGALGVKRARLNIDDYVARSSSNEGTTAWFAVDDGGIWTCSWATPGSGGGGRTAAAASAGGGAQSIVELLQ